MSTFVHSFLDGKLPMNPTHEFLKSISTKIGEIYCKFSIPPMTLPMIFYCWTHECDPWIFDAARCRSLSHLWHTLLFTHDFTHELKFQRFWKIHTGIIGEHFYRVIWYDAKFKLRMNSLNFIQMAISNHWFLGHPRAGPGWKQLWVCYVQAPTDSSSSSSLVLLLAHAKSMTRIQVNFESVSATINLRVRFKGALPSTKMRTGPNFRGDVPEQRRI